MHRLSNAVYKTIHTTGWMADLVYSLARHIGNLKSSYAHRKARSSGPTAKELYPVRHLVADAGMQTAVTNICNAKCSFCAYPQAVQSGALQRGVMSMEIFKKAVDEWGAIGGKNLDLTPTVGDSLLDPNLIEKIRYAVHTAGIKSVVLTTNAILMNRNEMYRQLVDSGLAAIFISTQGTDPEVYRQVYRVDKYDDVLSGVKNLMEYNRSRGEPLEIGVRFRNAQKPSEVIRSRDFREAIRPYLSERVRVNFTVDFDNWGGLITQEEMFGTMKLRKLPAPVNVPCKGLFSFVVRHDGNVRLCGCRFKTSDNDDMVVGNIKDNTMREISSSERTWKIIEGFYKGERPEACRECTFYRPITSEWIQGRQEQPGKPVAEKKTGPIAAVPAEAGSGK